MRVPISSDLDPIAFQVLWSRLVSIADEMAVTLVRTAFSRAVSDGHDYACAVYDSEGHMLAQSTHCTPGLIGAMPKLLLEILSTPHAQPIVAGDVFICNDPWLGAGHTPDIYIATPVFANDRLLGFCANAAHHIDVGGRGYSSDSREVFEEGVIIPITKLYAAGKPNEDLFRLLERNVRLPDKVVGDLRAQMAANHVGGARLVDLLTEREMDSLTDVMRQIGAHTETSMRRAIAQVPSGSYRHTVLLEQPDPEREPLRVAAQVDVRGDEIEIDFTGTSPQVNVPLNCVFNFTYAYSVFAMKSALHPHLPNNEGSVRPLTVLAPEASLLNATYPAPVMLRTSMVYYAVEAVFNALAEAIPGRVIAPSGTYPLWRIVFSGHRDDGKPFVYIFWANGGQGAAQRRDGLSAVVFPPNTSNTSAEIFEADTLLWCRSKEFVTDSGGIGEFRGGLAQSVAVENTGRRPVSVSAFGGRYLQGAPGLAGGGPGSRGRIQVGGGAPLRQVQQVSLTPGDVIDLEFPGGGGWGNAAERDPASVAADVRKGFVSEAAALRDYQVVLVPGDLTPDLRATEQRRTEDRHAAQ